ncbi:hypothetical protein EV356DRAFT_527930 [Viridothelium virens]|uniref:Carbohydrate esterase family 16 protein n=1 Tax=Viridothelium virens TaxID=1048519 RepID=A0A6A6HRD2_VIRVR|nr:hypothetical protein EV356DRAFT_527930 [Viridothelium virens]
MSTFTTLIVKALTFTSCASAAILPPAKSSAVEKRSPYRWNWVVAYGDELSDNGSGSYLADITGSPRDVYGFKTWTNGPVAITYLTQMLGTPMGWDYAIGGDNGGAGIGATINAKYTSMPPHIFSVQDQVQWYINNGSSDVSKTMQFIWVGQNDLSEHTDAFWIGDQKNADFAGNISTMIGAEVEKLVKAGAPAIFVANIYPKHKAPVTPQYLCTPPESPNQECIDNWGQIIQDANNAIENTLNGLDLTTEQKAKIIYYDVFSFMTGLMDPKTAAANGITAPMNEYCDGNKDSPLDQWNDCMNEGHANNYYWMSFTNPTTHVHKLIAADMKKAIDAHYAEP